MSLAVEPTNQACSDRHKPQTRRMRTGGTATAGNCAVGDEYSRPRASSLRLRTRSWTLDLTTFRKLYKSVFLSFLTQRPFISSSFWSPPCFPHLLSHYLKPKPNPAMQESNRRSPTPTKWCISRLTRMKRNRYNNSETNMSSNGKKKLRRRSQGLRIQKEKLVNVEQNACMLDL